MDSEDERREAAVRRLKAKRDFRTHFATYVIVNVGLVVIWAASGAGYFWPIWPILGWGIAVAFNAWGVYIQRPFSEDDIQAEMEDEPPSTSY